MLDPIYILRIWCNGNTSASQAGTAGSIPVIRFSNRRNVSVMTIPVFLYQLLVNDWNSALYV